MSPGSPADSGVVNVFTVAHCNFRSVPLALGMIQAYAQGPRLAHLQGRFRFIPLLNMPNAQLMQIARAFGPGIWLFSNYIWSFDQTMAASAAIKQADPRNVVIHGGPSTPKQEEAARRHLLDAPQIDIAVRGEGELTAADLIEHLVQHWHDPHRFYGLEAINGITYRPETSATDLIRTAERPRIADLDQLPSPYLTGVFDNCYRGKIMWGVLETTRGCPYQCTFCDWGALTAQKIKTFALDRVAAEIDWIGRKQISIVHVADANVGILDRDVEIAEYFAKARRDHGYPTHITCSLTKNGSPRVPEIARIWKRAGIEHVSVMSLQTSDPDTLKAIKRTNIKTESFTRQIAELREVGVGVLAELMIGLPAQTVASFKRDLQLLADEDVVVTAYRTRLLPNSAMAEPAYRAQYKIVTGADDMVISTDGATAQEVDEICQLYEAFEGCFNLSAFRYALFHLQWEHGVGIVEFLHQLVRDIAASPDSYAPVTRTLVEDTPGFARQLFEGEPGFFEDLLAFAERRFGITGDSALAAVVLANRSVLPRRGAAYPQAVTLPHDLAAYFADRMCGGDGERQARPLASYPPAVLTVGDADNWAGRDPEQLFPQIVLRLVNWEMQSELSQAMATRAAPRTDGNIAA